MMPLSVGRLTDGSSRRDAAEAQGLDRMPELESITVRGFKSIASIEELKLQDVNVLIGPNGSGKSNFIRVFQFLNSIQEGRLQEYASKEGGAERILHFGSKQTKSVVIHISFKDLTNQYHIELQPTADDQFLPMDERVYFWENRAEHERPFVQTLARNSMEAGISGSSTSRVATYVQMHLSRWRLYHFHDTSTSSPMKKASNVNDNAFLRPDGSNLASFLYLLRVRYPQSYDLIRDVIRRVAPFFKDFVLEPDRLKPDVMRLSWIHEHSDAYFDASSLSDGTLRFIALTTLFLQPAELKPSVILLDEPELGLHPYAIEMAASMAKTASKQTQVVLSTQSSLFLDHFDPADVLVANRVDGSTELTRLEGDKLSEWLEDFSLGQLWEKNVFGGRPERE
jgi:predicted ATPase